jgi:hypothetical protein
MSPGWKYGSEDRRFLRLKSVFACQCSDGSSRAIHGCWMMGLMDGWFAMGYCHGSRSKESPLVGSRGAWFEGAAASKRGNSSATSQSIWKDWRSLYQLIESQLNCIIMDLVDAMGWIGSDWIWFGIVMVERVVSVSGAETVKKLEKNKTSKETKAKPPNYPVFDKRVKRKSPRLGVMKSGTNSM